MKKAGLASRNIVRVVKTILRCAGFCLYFLQSETLPPTKEAPRQAIMRANFQALVWRLPEQELPSPETFGWKLDGDKCFEHVMHEDDNIVIIFKVVGNDITNNYFSILKKRYCSLVSMLTFSRDCFNSGN